MADVRKFLEREKAPHRTTLFERVKVPWISSRAVVVGSAFVVYGLVYLPLRSMVGMAAGLLSIVPIGLAGWIFGPLGGMLGGLLITLIHTILLNSSGSPGWDVVLRETSGIGPLIAVVLGVTVGYWSNLLRAYQQQIFRRKQAEAALGESEERLQLFVAYAPVALAMFDREMRYLAVSQRWITENHLEQKNILGASHYEIFPDLPENWKVALRRGLAGETVHADQEKIVRADGSVQWLRWVVLPWDNSKGEIGGIIVLIEDITTEKFAEKELMNAEQKYHALFEQKHDAVFIMDLESEAKRS